MYFFVAFARHYLSARVAHSVRDESLGSISAEPLLDTLNFKSFHQLHTLMSAYLDNLTVDKLHGSQLHLVSLLFTLVLLITEGIKYCLICLL